MIIQHLVVMSCGLAKTSPLHFVVVLQIPRKRSPVLRNCRLSLDTPIAPKLDWFHCRSSSACDFAPEAVH
jgi:hypothetical protein